MSSSSMKKIFGQTNSFLVTESRTCPVCKTAYLDRVHRRFIDRVISQFVEIKRYHCPACQWEGNLKIEK